MDGQVPRRLRHLEAGDLHDTFRLLRDTCYWRAAVQGAYHSHLGIRKDKIEDICIGLNPVAMDTLRDYDDPALDLIPQRPWLKGI